MATETFAVTTTAVTKAGERIAFPYPTGHSSGAYSTNGAILKVGGVTSAVPFGVSFDATGAVVTPAAGYEIAAGALTLTAYFDPPVAGRRIYQSSGAAATAHTGTTSETAIVTLPLPASTLGTDGIIRVRTFWTVTNSANVKTARVRLGGLAGTLMQTAPVTTNATMITETLIFNRASSASQYASGFANRGTDGLQQTTTVQTGTVNTAVAQDLVITAQLASAGESMTLEAYIIEI
jgi:hypothetical protein